MNDLKELEKILSVFSINIRRAYNNVEGFDVNEVHEGATQVLTRLLAEARINELTLLDNAFDEVTPDNFHQYYINRIKELEALADSTGQGGKDG